MAQTVKNLPAIWETQVQSFGGEITWRRKWLPTLIFLSGKSYGQKSLVAIVHGVSKSWTQLSD